MKQLDVEQLKVIQLGILDVVHDFCVKNNINYWLDCGTLLGAIRHRGYIPWDDDIDIGMLRLDYDKFMSSFNAANKRYQFLCPELNDDYSYGAGKVIDCDTVLYEPDKNGRKLSVNIDVFVYDNAPDDDRQLKKMFDRRDWYRKCSVAHSQNHDVIGGFARNIGFQLLHFCTKPFPVNYFALKMMDNSKRFSTQNTKRVGNFSSYTRTVGDKDIFNSFVYVSFEGKKYKAPVGYDKWLKAFYKNYMELPPVEKRVSTHTFEAYMKE